MRDTGFACVVDGAPLSPDYKGAKKSRPFDLSRTLSGGIDALGKTLSPNKKDA